LHPQPRTSPPLRRHPQVKLTIPKCLNSFDRNFWRRWPA